MDVASKKSAYALMATSVALMASNFPFAKIDKISIPGTSVSVPAVFLWLFFIFLFVPFTNEIKASNLDLKYKLGKKFNSALATWSRKKKEKYQPGLFTPQIPGHVEELESQVGVQILSGWR